MSPTIPVTIPTDPADEVEPAKPWAEVEGMDEGLHFGRAWHRYGYCYRQNESLRVLVAGCGTGRTSVWTARLNPGARVLGVDVSAEAVAAAREDACGLDVAAALDFHVHDMAKPLPVEWGRFDFVICRGMLARAADPSRLLTNLAQSLDPAGLLLVTIPTHSGRQMARSFQRAVDTLAAPGAGGVERTNLGLELWHALRPDHPIRAHVTRIRHDVTDPAPVVAGLLADDRNWNLDGAIALLSRANLRFLYAATPWRWQPDRVFTPDAIPDRVRHLAPDDLSRLIDALDPTLLDDHYQAHACTANYFPPLPDWPVTRADQPRTFEQLVPELTGVVDRSRFLPSGMHGRVTYQTASGTLGELDRWSHLLLGAVDGVSSCGEIERKLTAHARSGDDPIVRQDRWIDLADHGLILLKPFQAG
jgi:SAM-dependent methyltransferase